MGFGLKYSPVIGKLSSSTVIDCACGFAKKIYIFAYIYYIENKCTHIFFQLQRLVSPSLARWIRQLIDLVIWDFLPWFLALSNQFPSTVFTETAQILEKFTELKSLRLCKKNYS